MKLYLFKILSVFLAVWMVAITGGVHLYAHECACCEVQEISVVDIEQCCGVDEDAEICCETEIEAMAPCCEEPQIADFVEGTSCSTDGCCTVSHSYLKLDESFSTAGKILLKSYQVLTSLVQVLNDDSLQDDGLQDISFISDSSPPGYTGKAFLIFTHTLKIPLPL